MSLICTFLFLFSRGTLNPLMHLYCVNLYTIHRTSVPLFTTLPRFPLTTYFCIFKTKTFYLDKKLYSRKSFLRWRGSSVGLQQLIKISNHVAICLLLQIDTTHHPSRLTQCTCSSVFHILTVCWVDNSVNSGYGKGIFTVYLRSSE